MLKALFVVGSAGTWGSRLGRPQADTLRRDMVERDCVFWEVRGAGGSFGDWLPLLRFVFGLLPGGGLTRTGCDVGR